MGLREEKGTVEDETRVQGSCNGSSLSSKRSKFAKQQKVVSKHKPHANHKLLLNKEIKRDSYEGLPSTHTDPM